MKRILAMTVWIAAVGGMTSAQVPGAPPAAPAPEGAADAPAGVAPVAPAPPAPVAPTATPKRVPRGQPPTAAGAPAAPAAVPGMPPGKPMLLLGAAIKTERVTWLGVSASVATPAVREQLKLARGVGLVVDAVEDKGPAAEAGIKPLDLLEKLNDQWLVNVEQLTALVRSMKAGDEVKLSVFRQGARQEIRAKLAEKDVEVGRGGFGGFNGFRVGDLPAGLTPPMPTPADVRLWTAAPNVPGEVNIVETWNKPGVLVLDQAGGRQTTQWMDDEVEIDLERDGNKAPTRVIVKDRKTGKVMYTGPATLDPALLKVRPELADKVKKAQDAAMTTPVPMQFDVVLTEPTPVKLGGGGGGGIVTVGGRGKVTKWQDGDYVLIMRATGGKPVYLLALSKKDGRTVYDGPVMTDEQREGVPAEVSEQFKLVAARPDLATEFGGSGGVPTTPKPQAK